MRRILSCNIYIKHLKFYHGALPINGHPVPLAFLNCAEKTVFKDRN